MLMKQIMEAYDILDDGNVTGKKVEEYLLTIRVFVYLCVKFKFCYLRSNTHILLLIINILYIYYLSTQQFLT